MTSPRRRRAVVVAAAVATAALVVSGCGNGFDAGTNVERDPTDGVSVDTSTVQVRNLSVYVPAEGAPRLRATLVNQTDQDDAFVGAEVGEPPVAGTLVGGTEGQVDVRRNQTVVVGGDAEGAQVTFDAAELTAGAWVPVTLRFAEGGEASASALVEGDPVAPSPNPSVAETSDHTS